MDFNKGGCGCLCCREWHAHFRAREAIHDSSYKRLWEDIEHAREESKEVVAALISTIHTRAPHAYDAALRARGDKR